MIIEISNFSGNRIDKKYFQKTGEVILRRLKQPKNTEISLVFVDDKEMEKLNRKYRGENKTTDVLSFAYRDVKIPPSPPFLKGGKLLPPFLLIAKQLQAKPVQKGGWGGFLGEIVISVPQARRQCLARRQDCCHAVGLEKHGGQAKTQAKGRSYPLKAELTELFVHGILHLIGYDDETEEGYEKMIKKQDEILSFLNN